MSIKSLISLNVVSLEADPTTPTPVDGDVYYNSVTQRLRVRAGGAWVELAAAPTAVAPNTQTGTTYTLVLADAGKAVEMNNALSNTLTVPPNSSVPFPVGTITEVMQLGAGPTTIAAGAGVTIRSRDTDLILSGQYATASLRKRATDEWVLAGDL